MSTIASPREPSLSGRRIPLHSTPTSSSRPSLDIPRPIPETPPSSNASTFPNPNIPPKRNRAALREYYNLQKASQAQTPSSPTSSSIHSFQNDDVGEFNEMDQEGFDAEAYVRKVLEEKSLAEVLGIYKGVLSDVRALDAERKALVYDNYSKLIVATEMIGRMRKGVGESASKGVAKTDLKTGKRGEVEGVEELVERVRRGVEGLRREGEEGEKREREERVRRARGRMVVERVLGTPARVRGLVAEGKENEARVYWEGERRLLERWRERGVGGDDVGVCIEEGDKALQGEERGAGEKMKP